MNIQRLYYPVTALGPGRRLGIWTRGCTRRCPGCMSPELWDRRCECEIALPKIIDLVGRLAHVCPIDGVTVSGGEPFDQPEELAQLLSFLKDNVTSDLLVYTGYTLQELEARGDGPVGKALKQIGVLIDGPYDPEQNKGTPLRGSSNQGIHFFTSDLQGKYESVLKQQRDAQLVETADGLLIIGIL